MIPMIPMIPIVVIWLDQTSLVTGTESGPCIVGILSRGCREVPTAASRVSRAHVDKNGHFTTGTHTVGSLIRNPVESVEK